MTAFRFGSRLSGCIAVAALVLAVPVALQTYAQDTTPKTAAQSGQASSSAAASSSEDTQTITLFGKKRKPGDPTQARIDTQSASSCGFMNTYNSANDPMVQNYLQSFGADDNDSSLPPDTNPSDPNGAGTNFKDNSPYGNASQDNAANANTLAGMQVGPSGALNTPDQAGACGPSDKAFAAGRNYIARNDTSLRDAFAAFDAKDYAKALILFKKSYDKMGYDAAALMEGKMYLAGLGTPRDVKQAIIWLKKVAEGKYDGGQSFNPDDPDYMSGRSDAAMTLAKIYMTGNGVPRDSKEAKHWYSKADEFGFIPATHLMGEIYEYGYAGEKSLPKAVSYFKKAGTVGYAPSQYELGVILYNGGDGVAQDPKQAAQWLLEAAKRGHPGALYAVGRMYDLGEILPQDSQKAIVYYKEAALKGQPEAENAMGLYFYTGEIVAKDLVIARKWFELAAKQGEADAMFNLAVMLANGEGGPKDMAVAYVWLRLAEKSGLEKAGPAAKELEGKMTPEERARADSVLTPKK